MEIICTQPMTRAQLAQAVSGKKLIAGAKQIRKALAAGKVCSVYLAADADPGLTEPLLVLCKTHNTEPCWVRSMLDLGRACGIEVGAAAAAALH